MCIRDSPNTVFKFNSSPLNNIMLSGIDVMFATYTNIINKIKIKIALLKIFIIKKVTLKLG